MRTNNHNTHYYGGEIINTINNTIGKYVMDRGGKYAWVYDESTVLYLDLYENNNLGQLEWHHNGEYKCGITPLTVDDDNFDELRITNFIKNFF